MMSYCFAFAWGFLILFSLIGWGELVKRFLFPHSKVDWGLLAIWGLALSIFVGGLLNVTWTISQTVILIYLLLGILSFIFHTFKNINTLFNSGLNCIKNCQKDYLLLIFISLNIFCILIQYAAWVSTDTFHDHDDFFGYFVFPEKMLQIGSLGPDPYSGRRLISALGGQSFLQTFILCLLNEKNLHIIDPGIASLIIIGLILGFLKEKNFSSRMKAILIFPFLLVVPPITNTTNFVIGSALILGLFRTINWIDSPISEQTELKKNNLINNALIISLITSATITCKSTLIPSTILLFSLSYFFYIIYSENKRIAIGEFICSSFLTFALLLPWMLSMYQSSGTFLFPLLGKGYHASVYYDHYAESYGEIKWLILPIFNLLHIALFFLTIVYIQSQPWKNFKFEKRGATFSLIISMILGAIITIIVTNGYHERYTFPFVIVAIVILIITLLVPVVSEDIERKKFPNFSAIIVVILAISLIIGNGNGWNGVKQSYLLYIKNIIGGLSNQFSVSTPEEVLQYVKMQQSIPENEILLTRLNKPFLLNFHRNPIYIVDLPGYASPPPGMPLFKGSEALSDYLSAKSIRYIAFDYAKQPGADRGYWQEKLGDEIYPWVKQNRILEIRPFLRRQIQYTLDFHDSLQKLGKSRKKVYDDGKIFIIDLLSKPNQS